MEERIFCPRPFSFTTQARAQSHSGTAETNLEPDKRIAIWSILQILCIVELSQIEHVSSFKGLRMGARSISRRILGGFEDLQQSAINNGWESNSGVNYSVHIITKIFAHTAGVRLKPVLLRTKDCFLGDVA